MARQTTTSAFRRGRRILAVATAAAAMVTVAACGGGSGGGPAATGDTSKITVSYRQFGASEVQKNFLTKVKAEFEKSHPGVTVDLQPVLAGEAEYPTKLQLAMRSERTSPDLVYEDTFQINSDIQAGYLRPLDDRIAASGTSGASSSTPRRAAAKALGRQDLRHPGRHRHPWRSGSTRRSSPRPGCRPTGSPRPGTRSSPRHAPSRRRSPASSR